MARAAPVDGMRCLAPRRITSAAHLEVFAAGHVLVVPAGIGFAYPLRRHGAYVSGGRCAYPVRSTEPTGLLLLEADPHITLGRLFDLWGQRLGPRVLAGFSAPAGSAVAVFIDGARWRGAPSRAPLVPWAQVAVEIGPQVTPHLRYSFPSLRTISSGR